MLAVRYDDQLQLVRNYPDPVLVQGEALIHPHLVGICNTDIEIMRGYKGFHGTLGHEFVGTVTACDDQTWVGRRVVGEINAACFRCPVCLSGQPSHCPKRTTLGISGRDGAMAEVLSLPVQCLYMVPASISDRQAVFVEPLAAAIEMLDQCHIRPTDHVALVGDGKLGLLCAQVLRLTGAAVTVIGRHPERWELLRKQAILTRHEQEQHALAASQFDLVVECTGNRAGLETAVRLVRPRGRLVMKSTIADLTDFDATAIVVQEIQIIGSRCGPFAAALRILERGLVDVESLISATYPLDAALDAFAAAHGQLKILLEV